MLLSVFKLNLRAKGESMLDSAGVITSMPRLPPRGQFP